MRTILTLLLAVSAACTIASCSQVDSDLEITVQNSRVYLIPATAQSCNAIATQTSTSTTSNDVSAKFFLLQNPVLHWKSHDQSFVLNYISVKFTDPAITPQECIISGSELGYLYGTGVPLNTVTPPTQWVDYTILAAPAGQGEVTKSPWTSCPQIKCGGFKVAGNSVRSFTAQLKAVGYEQDSSGADTPVTATQSVVVTNTSDGN